MFWARPTTKDYIWAEHCYKESEQLSECVHTFTFITFFFCYNCIAPMGFLPWEIRVAFPGKSQLWQSCATQPIVHAGCFSVSTIHWTLTWTTGSSTCAQMLMQAIAHRGVWTHIRVCTESWLWEKNPLPQLGIKPVSAAWQSDALTNWATHPHHGVFSKRGNVAQAQWLKSKCAPSLCSYFSIDTPLFRCTFALWSQFVGMSFTVPWSMKQTHTRSFCSWAMQAWLF